MLPESDCTARSRTKSQSCDAPATRPYVAASAESLTVKTVSGWSQGTNELRWSSAMYSPRTSTGPRQAARTTRNTAAAGRIMGLQWRTGEDLPSPYAALEGLLPEEDYRRRLLDRRGPRAFDAGGVDQLSGIGRHYVFGPHRQAERAVRCRCSRNRERTQKSPMHSILVTRPEHDGPRGIQGKIDRSAGRNRQG